MEIQREDSNISLKRPTTTTTTTTSDPKDNTTYRSKIEEMDNILGLRQNYEPVQSGTTKRSKLSSTSQPRRSKRGHAHPGPEPLPQNSRDIESPDKQDCGKPSLTADIGTPEKPIDKYSRMSEMDRILFGGGDCHVTITNANNPEEEGKQEILESISDDSDEDDGHDVKDDDNDKTHDISRRKAQIDYLLGFQYHNNESTFPSSDVQDLEDDSDQEGTSINNTWSTARDRIDFEMGLLNHDRRAEMDRILGCLHSTQYY